MTSARPIARILAGALLLLACAPAAPARAQASSPGAAPDTRTKVAILVFNGVEIIDSTGPYEVLGAAGYDVYTVAESTTPVTTAMGLTLVPKYDFATAPAPDVLLVPGGNVRNQLNDSTLVGYVAATAAHARHAMSVCNGAFLLAKAGLLDGLTATTTYGNVVPLQNDFPKVKVVGDRRYVDNGHVLTTAGLSAGMDGALHLVAVMDGEQQARDIALQEEYDWRPEGGWKRPSLADRMVPRVNLNQLPGSVGTWSVASSKGDADAWEVAFKGGSQLSAGELLEKVGALCANGSRWAPAPVVASAAATPGRAASDWNVNGLGGTRWRGRVAVAADPSAAGRYTLTLAVARAR